MINIPHKVPSFLQRLYPSCTWHRPRKENKIYLTFDDGPVPEITEFVVDQLEQHKIKATFFCVGDNIIKHPQVFDRLINTGQEIGNHTFNHINGWKHSQEDYLKNVQKAQEAIARPARLFRPPYGRIKRQQIASLVDAYEIIMWDVLSGDYQKTLTPEKCLEGTINALRPGAIVVFHDNMKAFHNLEYALPRFITHCHNEGFEFGTL